MKVVEMVVLEAVVVLAVLEVVLEVAVVLAVLEVVLVVVVVLAVLEVGFQDAEEMEEVEVGPSFSTHSGDRTNMRNHLEVERPHPTSKPLPP